MKILVIHASAGAGHTKAAEALYNCLKNSTTHEAVLVDALDYTNKFYKFSFQKGYAYLITKLPDVWATFFNLTDLKFLRGLIKCVRRFFNTFNARGLNRFLIKEQFDYILSTHFFPNEVCAFLKRKNLIHSKIICAVTDFDVHSFWLAEGIDYYAAASEYTREKLRSQGILDNQIFVTGIPTDKKFSDKKDIQQLKDKLRVKKGIFTVLIATGSFGIGPIEEIVLALRYCQVLVVCGRNQALFERLSKSKPEYAKIYGLINNMHELMAVSDCMVTKPGGLSIAEALVNELPLVFFNAIPGQEQHNVQILQQYGVGVESQGHVALITYEIDRFRNEKDYLSEMKQKIRQLARPSASEDIIRLLTFGQPIPINPREQGSE